MGTIWNSVAAVLGGVLFSAVALTAQTQTISARPGAVNYIEGAVSVNNKALSTSDLRATFLNANDLLSTGAGKAEILLTPGVFMRIGEDSEVRMVSPSLTETQVELTRGEAMIEATGLVKDNNLQVIDHGSVTTIKKNGLYRFTAGIPPLVAVFDGKAEVELDDRKVNLKKGRQTVLAADAKAEKFDRDQTKTTNDLYAWSNVRSEYEAAASYRVSQSASLGMLGGGGYGLGPGPVGSGWYWDNGFSSWAWLPGSGAFFSPFGYGFYSPGLVGYAPVVRAPIYGGGGYYGGRRWNGNGNGNGNRPWKGNPPNGANGWRPGAPGGGGVVGTAPVPVRPPGGWRGNGGAPGAGSWRGGGGSPGSGGGWRNGGGNPGGGGWRNGGGGNPGGGASRPSFNGGGGAGGGWRGGGGGASGGGRGAGGPRGK